MLSTYEYLDTLNKENQFYNLYKDLLEFENIYFIPAITFDTALFLYNIVFLKKPTTILEIGFGAGVSTVFIKKSLIDNKIIQKYFISIERDKNRFNRGKRLLEKYNFSDIKLLNIDAFNFFEINIETFDFIFLDAVKREYILYLDKLKNRLKKDAILICDNILFKYNVVKDNLEKKYRDATKLLKEFNLTIAKEKELKTSFYNIGDGISLSIKI